jgi:hypothetical protein
MASGYEACKGEAAATDAAYRSAMIDKAEREAEAEQSGPNITAPDWSTLSSNDLEKSRALRKKVELQQKLKAKHEANKAPLTEEEMAEAKAKTAQLASEAIKTIEEANQEKQEPAAPQVKLGQNMVVSGEGDMTQQEKTRLQASIGAGKAGKSKAFFQQQDQKRDIEESEVADDEVISFYGCKNCEYTVNARCTKIFVERCEEFILHLNGTILTSTVEVDACEKMNLLVNTKIGTLQVERCSKVNVLVRQKEDFHGFMIWAGCFMLRLQVEEAVMSCDFGLTQKLDPTINLERTQFKVWMNSAGKLSCDKVIRLKNGFPTTKREDDEHTRREEEKLGELAKRMGITVHRKEDAIGGRVKPNELCPCGSKQKYKKCCQSGAARLAAQKLPAVLQEK